MYLTLTDLYKALLDRFDALKSEGINPVSKAARDWYEADKQTQNLIKLTAVYEDALADAPKEGWIGVGCITFAQKALIKAQEDK